MPKPPLHSRPSSAIESELLAAAQPLQTPARAADQHAEAVLVRREFAISRELDEFIGFALVPLIRNAFQKPVNRSMIVRGLLQSLLLQRVALQARLGGIHPDASRRDLDAGIAEVFARVLVIEPDHREE